MNALKGVCHCGDVAWRFEGMPASATACNCTVCRRYGALWAYGYEGDVITTSGATTAYMRGKVIEFHFCCRCGCMMFYRVQLLDSQGRRKTAINLRMTDPEPVAALPIEHFDGLVTFDDLPKDERCVKDYWF